jgi:adenine-specific DNA methylase
VVTIGFQEIQIEHQKFAPIQSVNHLIGINQEKIQKRGQISPMKFIDDVSKEKLRGGFYTPSNIAYFILKWAVNGNKDFDILEPSCGDGIFLRQIKKNNFDYKSLTAIEIDDQEVEKADKINLQKKNIINTDFFEWCNSTNKKFDLIIGNPPYIRYQFFDKKQREQAELIFKRADLKYSKLQNAWVSFVVGSSLLLKKKGKIGFVIPAELLQVSFAEQLRSYLAHHFNKINIISFKKLIFPKIQQEVILLLCEKNGKDTHRIEHIELESDEGLKKLDVTKLKCPKKKIDFKSNKWTFYFLDQEEIDFIEKYLSQKKIKPLRDFATVEVGITTGANKFFTVPKSIVEDYNLKEYAEPLVGRSVQVPSIIFNDKDWQMNIGNGTRTFLLKFPNINELKNNQKALKYIRFGEREGFSKWYKNRIRDEWQIVPSTWISDALFIRRNNIYPRLIRNDAKAYTTDTMHRVKIKSDIDVETNKSINESALIASYYNSLSFAFAEICGRSHGGGALELMPNEVENILIPYDEKNADLLQKIDRMMRSGKNIDDILEYTDKKILIDRYNLSEKDVDLAKNIWKKLLNRRMKRGKKSKISV